LDKENILGLMNILPVYTAALDENGCHQIQKNLIKILIRNLMMRLPFLQGMVKQFILQEIITKEKEVKCRRVTLIKIYKATIANNQWTNITELPFNSDNYSTAHPTLSRRKIPVFCL
jgi:hypothetical protein